MYNFKEQLQLRTNEANSIIERFLPAANGHQQLLLEAMNYSIIAGGKRIRPILIKEFYKLFGGEEEIVGYFMTAMEMLHTSSLVHDDLPCIDNDDYRRGMLTTWKKYGEDVGLLCGDALIGYAFETALKGYSSCKNPDFFFKALKILADKSGCYGMLGGQFVDVSMTGKDLSNEQIDFIYRMKTSALIEASMMIGAALAGVSDDVLNKIEQIGYGIGIAFQIKDDILDITGDEKLIGKPVNSDDKNGKRTYVSTHGLSASEKEINRLTALSSELLDSISTDNDFIKELFNYLIYRNN